MKIRRIPKTNRSLQSNHKARHLRALWFTQTASFLRKQSGIYHERLPDWAYPNNAVLEFSAESLDPIQKTPYAHPSKISKGILVLD